MSARALRLPRYGLGWGGGEPAGPVQLLAQFSEIPYRRLSVILFSVITITWLVLVHTRESRESYIQLSVAAVKQLDSLGLDIIPTRCVA